MSSGIIKYLKSAKKLTLSLWRSLSYRKQSIDSQSKWMDWFLYSKDLHQERVNELNSVNLGVASTPASI